MQKQEKMTVQDAYNLLGAKEKDSDEQIESLYKEAISQMNLRIKNAPDHLQVKFQNNLNDVHEAYKLIKEFRSISTEDGGFLPSSDKIETEEKKDVNSAGKVEKTNPKGLSQKQQRIYLAIIIGTAVLASSFVVLYVDAKTKREEVEKKVAKYEEGDRMWNKYKETLKQGKMSVVNKGSKPFVITYLRVFYFEDGKMKNQTFQNLPDWINPGSSKSFQKTVGTVTEYNGEAYFYVLSVADESGQEMSFEGILQTDALPVSMDK